MVVECASAGSTQWSDKLTNQASRFLRSPSLSKRMLDVINEKRGLKPVPFLIIKFILQNCEIGHLDKVDPTFVLFSPLPDK